MTRNVLLLSRQASHISLKTNANDGENEFINQLINKNWRGLAETEIRIVKFSLFVNTEV